LGHIVVEMQIEEMRHMVQALLDGKIGITIVTMGYKNMKLLTKGGMFTKDVVADIRRVSGTSVQEISTQEVLEAMRVLSKEKLEWGGCHCIVVRTTPGREPQTELVTLMGLSEPSGPMGPMAPQGAPRGPWAQWAPWGPWAPWAPWASWGAWATLGLMGPMGSMVSTDPMGPMSPMGPMGPMSMGATWGPMGPHWAPWTP